MNHAKLVADWTEGVNEFNAGRYWEAHECWERGWVKLPAPERLMVQAVIQVAGVLHLLQSPGRRSGAHALARAALPKLRDTTLTPRIEIPGAKASLQRWLDQGLEIKPENLIARLIL